MIIHSYFRCLAALATGWGIMLSADAAITVKCTPDHADHLYRSSEPVRLTFAADDDGRPFGQTSHIEFQFALQMTVIFIGRPPVNAGHVQYVSQHMGPFDVFQEGMAEPDIGVSAVNQARNIGDGQSPVSRQFNDADHRMQCRERVGGDFGTRLGNRPQQRGFAGVGIADQADVGDGFQFQFQPAFFAGLALFALARRPVGAGGETGVAASAFAALSNDELQAGGIEVGKQFAGFLIGHHGADRHVEYNIRRFAAMQIFALAVGTVGGGIMTVVNKIDQTLFVGGSS